MLMVVLSSGLYVNLSFNFVISLVNVSFSLVPFCFPGAFQADKFTKFNLYFN